MSPLTQPAGGRGFLSGVGGFVQVMRELDLGEIREQLGAPVRILVTSPEPAEAASVAAALFGANAPLGWSVAVAPLADSEHSDDEPDLVLLSVSASEDPFELLGRYRRRRVRAETPVVAILLGARPLAPRRDNADAPPHFAIVACDSAESEALAEQVPPVVLDLLPDRELSLGRRFSAFRGPVAERLIRQTSRVNAQFALLSSLPASLPLLGGAAAGLADTVLLTKNQGVLVYKLAGLFGRNLGDHASIAIEIAPVIGGAFFWRSLARSLVGLLPPIAGALPKAAIAYTGTYAVGHMARYYYSTGRRPPPELVARFQAEGDRLAGELAVRLRRMSRQ